MAALPKDMKQKLLNEVVLDSQDDYVERGSQLEKALIRACAQGDVAELIKILQTNKIGVNVRLSERAWTPLMFAIHFNRKELFDFLLKQPSIELSIRDNTGQTALGFALKPLSDFFKPNYDVAHQLISVRADVNEMLVMAWMTQNEEVAKKLIGEFGARIDLAEAFVNADTYKSYCVGWAEMMKSSMKFIASSTAFIPSLDSDTYKRYAGRWDEFNPCQNVIELMEQKTVSFMVGQLKLEEVDSVETSTQAKHLENPVSSFVPAPTMVAQPAPVIFSKPLTPKEGERKLEKEFNFEGKTDYEIINSIVQQFKLPIAECECPMFRRDTKDNVRDYIPALLLQKLAEQSWPKEREIVITDIGSGQLKQAATIACALVRAGYSVKFNLVDNEYKDQQKAQDLIAAFEKILEILNNTFPGKARINAHAHLYQASQHGADFLLIIDGIDRLEELRKIEGLRKTGQVIYENFCQRAKAQNPNVVCVATKELPLNVNVMCNDKIEKHFSDQPAKGMGLGKSRNRRKILGGSDTE